jgi:spore coat polysaccharide biosynthesis protein SpsF (cytidylyltransferase family)
VDLTGDCPLIDPGHIDKVLELLFENGMDYSSNIWPRSWPDGFDVQAYTIAALTRAHGKVRNKKHRCHVGWNLQTPDIKQVNYCAPAQWNRPSLRVTLDTREDLDLIRKIADHFGHNHFTAGEVVDLIVNEKPEWIKINLHVIPKKPGEG